ncbi:MAG: biopolymer transporter ExbD [Candidatus Omnitrophica bacterium]|nr:biopolymer transporter ExbD [Candidatus Omnitrophota bacterium]
MEFEKRKAIDLHLDIAPLIDIVFLLLIFFMLTANFVLQSGIKITLPSAVAAEPQKEKKQVVIFISKDNKIFLDSEQISIAGLKDALKEKIEINQNKGVVLKADEKINLGLAVRVMDIAKQAKAEGLVISTKTVNSQQSTVNRED